MSVLSTGSVLGDFRIEDEVGRGGMGVVYRAVQLSLGRPVALKVIAATLSDNIGFRERFARESRLAASLDHPNVIPVYAAGQDGDVLYIAMRFVEGTDLRSLIASEGRLDALRAAGVVAQVASALDAAHERGLVHRDVKPANVLVTARGGGEHVYLTDFGLTKRSASESGLTAAGEWVGTLDYVAPEQLRGDAVDGRADVYALGCVLYEMLTGEVPFPRDDDIAKLWAHISDPPPTADDLVPGLPRRLAGVATRAMDKDPDERFATAGEMGRAALAAVPGGGDTRARARIAASGAGLVPSRGSGGSKPPLARRGAGLAMLAALALLVVVVAVALAVAWSGEEDDIGSAARSGDPPPPQARIVGRPVPVGDEPIGVSVGADGVWVANRGSNTVTLVDPRRQRAVATIPVGEDPVAVAAGPRAVWVANFGDGTVSKIDSVLRRVIATIPVGAAPTDVLARTDMAFIATEDDRLLRIDASTNQVIPPVTRMGAGGAIDRSDDVLWVLDREDGSLRSLDLRSGLLQDTMHPLGRDAVDVVASPTEIWASVASEGLVRGFPVAPGRPQTAVRTGGRPEALAQDTRWLWVTDTDREAIWKIDPRSHRPTGGPLRVGEDPRGAATGAAGLWIAVTGRDRVLRVESAGP